MKLRVGILGGTFDPIHKGHVYIARRVRQLFQLNQVLFMVAKTPPHKERHGISQIFHRYAMVAIELLYEDDFYASRREIQKAGPSYTIETLQELEEQYPNDEFLFIAGSDSLREIHLWKDYDKLLANHSMIFVQRPGAEVDLDSLSVPPELKKRIKHLCPAKGPRTVEPGVSYLASLNAPSVSSTMLRKLIANGGRVTDEQVSPNVYQYILKYRLYERNKGSAKQSLSGD
ncbi:MAG TPA: nicotinate-nucleotide adenylyltransferase [Acidobacteriota bacterium]|nr:nicotinate-nucleotide adenylyltransferase [Acidobacteriota bacterium]